MALKEVENDGGYAWGPTSDSAPGAAGLSGVISKSTQNSFQSEVELVGGDGELVDVLYSGSESTVTETKYGTTFEHGTIGTGTYTGDGIIAKVSVQYSNEDASKVVTERLKKLEL
jgi:hypothetical protein